MTSKNLDRLLFVAAIVMAAMLFAGVRLAYAQHECQGGHNCNDAGIGDIGIVNEIAGDDFRALSVSQSLGAAAISGCIVTTQWGIPIIFQRQGYHYDVFCLARELDQVGKYDDAAAMRCTHKDTAKLYAERCLTVMNFKPANTNTGPSNTSEPQGLMRAQEENDDHQQRDDRLAAIEQRLDQDAAARRAYGRQVALDKRVEQQRAFDAFNAYKAAQQMEEPPQQEEPPHE